MKKIIKLTESDLNKIIKKIMIESDNEDEKKPEAKIVRLGDTSSNDSELLKKLKLGFRKLNDNYASYLRNFSRSGDVTISNDNDVLRYRKYFNNIIDNHWDELMESGDVDKLEKNELNNLLHYSDDLEEKSYQVLKALCTNCED